jgi:HAD domain in Swiss Army Knife RNA repair proteins
VIVFLDFDGVLHPVPLALQGVLCRLDLFESWLRNHPTVDVVLSSSWRETYPFRELVGFFAEDMQHRIVGCTPVLSNSHPERETEVRTWMRNSWEPSRPFAILDDLPDLFSPGCPELVLCDPRVGLTHTALAELQARLGLVDTSPNP